MISRTVLAQNLIALETEGVPLGRDPLTGPGRIGEAVNTALDTNTHGVAGGGVVDVFSQQFSNLIGLLTVLGGVFLVIYFLLAAFEWIQAGGDAGKVEKAQQRMVNGAIGMLVMIIAFGIIGIIGGVFGIELLNPGQVFLELIQDTP